MGGPVHVPADEGPPKHLHDGWLEHGVELHLLDNWHCILGRELSRRGVGEWKNRKRESGIEDQGRGEGEDMRGRKKEKEKGERVREWKVREKGGGRGERREEETEEHRSKLFCIYVTARLLTVDPFVNRSTGL